MSSKKWGLILAWGLWIALIGTAFIWVSRLDPDAPQPASAPLPPIITTAPQPAKPKAPAIDQRPQYHRMAHILEKPIRGTKIAVVVTGLGPDKALTQKIIQTLPPEFTLAFTPYTRNLPSVMRQARAFGHETLLMVPMEPATYPRRDPGPLTLLTSTEPQKNLQKFTQALSRGQDFVGVTDFMGSRFMESAVDLKPILEATHKQGLLFFDSKTTLKTVAPSVSAEISLPYLQSTDTIDLEITTKPLKDYLSEITERATQRSEVIVRVSALPMVIDILKDWSNMLTNQSVTLVPLTAMLPVHQRPKTTL